MATLDISIAGSVERLKASGFERITSCDDCEQCLFFHKGEETASLADPTTGLIFTMKQADWQALCEKIRSGEIQ